MKKVLQKLLVFMILASMALSSVTAMAATKSSEKTSGIFTYTVSNKTATITKITIDPDVDVVIPDTIDGYQVTVIGSGTQSSVFDGSNFIKSIKLPSGLKSIGAYAFNGIQTEEEIVLPNSLTSIGESAFELSATNASITIPGSVTHISANAFATSGLNKVTILSGVKTIGAGAFSECTGLTSITLPDSITSIGESAFAGCSLKSIKLPKNLKVISARLFSYGDNSYQQLPDGTTIPSGVKSIGDYAFAGCGFTSITIPEGVTSIGDGAFHATALKAITIPKSVKTIGTGDLNEAPPFAECANLKKAYILGKTTSWSTDFNAFNDTIFHFAVESKVTVYAQKGSKAETLAKFFKMKFIAKTSAQLNALTKVKPTPVPVKTTVAVPASFAVKYTPFTATCTWKAVPGATGYEIYNLNMSGKYELVGSTTSELSYTKKITPHDVYNFAVRAYNTVSGIKKYSAYSDCVDISADPDEITSGDFTYYLYNKGAIITGYNINSQDIIIPDTIDGYDVTNIKHSAFEDKAISSVVLPKHMKVIADGLLYHIGITNVTIPDGVESIDSLALAGTYLTYIIMPSSVKNISDNAFDFLQTTEFMIFAPRGSYAQKYAKTHNFLFVDTSNGVTPTTISPLVPEASLTSKFPYNNYGSSYNSYWGSSNESGDGYDASKGFCVIGNRLYFSEKNSDYMLEINKITKNKSTATNADVWLFSGRCRNLQDAGNTWDTDITVTIQQNYDVVGDPAVTGIVMPKGPNGDEVNFKGALVIGEFLE